MIRGGVPMLTRGMTRSSGKSCGWSVSSKEVGYKVLDRSVEETHWKASCLDPVCCGIEEWHVVWNQCLTHILDQYYLQ